MLAIDDRRVHLRTEHGERIALARSDPQLRHLDHAYSSTVHGAQGRTHRSVIAVLGSAGLTDQTMLYVEMSRASDEFLLLTDDREALAEVLLHRPGLEESALEAIGEALTAPPVVEPEVYDKLRADWAAVRTRAEAAGDIRVLHRGVHRRHGPRGGARGHRGPPRRHAQVHGTLLAEHKANRARAQSVTRLIRRMQTHWRRWPELGRGSPDPDTKEPPAHRQWRTDANHMLDTARAWLAGDTGIARHLDAMPEARAGLETAVRDVERVGTLNDYRLFERRWRTRFEPARPGRCSTSRTTPSSRRLAEALRDADALTRTQHELLGEWRAAHAEETARLERIERYPDEAAALIAERGGPSTTPTTPTRRTTPRTRCTARGGTRPSNRSRRSGHARARERRCAAPRGVARTRGRAP